MNKEFEYRGHKFNIKVELNVQMERRPKRHIITVSSTSGTDYHKEYQTQDNSLIGLEAYIDFADRCYKYGEPLGLLYYNASSRTASATVITLVKVGNVWFRGYEFPMLSQLRASCEINLSEFMGKLKHSAGYVQLFSYNSIEADTYEQSRKRIYNGVRKSKIDNKLIDLLSLNKYRDFLIGGKPMFDEDIEFLKSRSIFLKRELAEINSKIKFLT